MKIVVEEGDERFGLAVGTHDVLVESISVSVRNSHDMPRLTVEAKFHLLPSLITVTEVLNFGNYTKDNDREAHVPLPKKAPCRECSGTGFYVSPVSGKKSRCSAGCCVQESHEC